MTDYRFEILEQVKEVINELDVSNIKRITLDLDDSYLDETSINIDIELNKEDN